MFRCRSHSQPVLLLLGLIARMLGPCSAHAGSCNKDPDCRLAAENANAATTSEQRQRAITELQDMYSRFSEPRLLAIVGRLQQKEGLHEEAQKSCAQAKLLAPQDLDLQQKVNECLAGTRPAVAQEAKKSIEHLVQRLEAKGGTGQVDVTMVNHMSPVTTVNVAAPNPPTVHIVNSPPAPGPPSAHRQWWVWTGLGLLAAGVIGTGVALGIGLASRELNTAGYPTFHIALVTQ